jgi:histidinol-phosphate aminotransferase
MSKVKKNFFVYDNIRTTERLRIPENRDLINGIRLNRNERVKDFPQNLLSKIFKGVKQYDLGKYPDQNFIYKHLSRYLRIKKENILLSSGIDGSLKSIFEIFLKPSDRIAYLSPSYAMYPVFSKIYNLNLISIPYDKFKLDKKKIIQTIKSGIKILFLPNPNQPIEDNLSLKDLRQLATICKKFKVLMVVDEAYYMFGSETGAPLINKFENIIILRTFSKSFGLPSIRLGYILANKKIIKIFDTFRLSYESNFLTDKVAIYFLENNKIIKNYIEEVKEGRNYIKKELLSLNLKVIGGKSNFLLVVFKNKNDYMKIYNKLTSKKIYVKGGYKGDLENAILFTCGPKKIMNNLLKIIKTIL